MEIWHKLGRRPVLRRSGWRRGAACLAAAALLAGAALPAGADDAVRPPPAPSAVRSEITEQLEPADLRDPAGLLTRLRQARDPLSRYLRDNCAPATRRMLGAYTDPSAAPDAALVQAVVGDLNRQLRAGSLYEPDRFDGVSLDPATRKLLRTNPRGAELVHLNRLLLEDAYPEALVRRHVQPLDVKADSLDFEHEKDIMIATGNVVVRKDDEILRSDYAVINLESQDVMADGRVAFQRGNDTWVGDRLNYNFKSKRGDFGEFRAFLAPFYVNAKSSQRTAADEFLLRDASFTTCEGEEPAVYLRAKTARIIPNHSVRAYHVVMYMGGIPVFYFPFWFQNIGTRNFISIVPGYNNRMGLFLLTALNYRLSRHLEAATHVDVRTRRGLGVGQDLMWSSSGNSRGLSTERYASDDDEDEITDIWNVGSRYRSLDEMEASDDRWFGDLIAYYTGDSRPDEGKEQAYPLDGDRYRLRLYHNQSFTDNDYLLLQANYLSDPKVIQQFFREEYKTYPEPENYLVLGHRTQNYSLSIQAQKRFNDFYTAVDRVPEVNFDITRQEIGESRFYYESENSAAYLEKVWEENATNQQDYSAGRLHTAHSVNYPVKFFGFLNLIPRAGYRGTYYSHTKEDYRVVSTNTSLDTNGVAVSTVSTNQAMRELDADFRNLYEFGLESSFKAFKVWQTHPGDFINNLRHIVEPYADYTYIPEPNLRPADLYQFDDLDELDRRNDIKLGLRNKIQTKRREIYDLINADIWTYYRLDPQADEEDFDSFFFDVRSEPWDWVDFRIDGEYDQYESELKTLNTRLLWEEHTFWSCELEHRYRLDANSLLNAELRINPFINWGYKAYTRYEFEESEMEAWGISVRRTIDCVAVEVGYEWEDDDYEVWLQFWFTEFPRGRVNVGL